MTILRILLFAIELVYFYFYRVVRFFSREGARYLVPVACFAAYLIPLYIERDGFPALTYDTPFSIIDWFTYPFATRPTAWVVVDVALLSLGTAFFAFPDAIGKICQIFVDLFPAPGKPILRRAALKAKKFKVEPAPVGVAVKRKRKPLWVIAEKQPDPMSPAVTAIIIDEP